MKSEKVDKSEDALGGVRSGEPRPACRQGGQWHG